MTNSHDDGYWEELSFVWVHEFPYDDEPETYEVLNRLLPDDMVFTVIRRPDARISLMKYYTD